MSLVVVDGEPASMKALELCCVPGVIVKAQDKEQLVVVHVWKDYAEPHHGAGGAEGEGAASVAATAVGVAAATHRATPIGGMPPLPGGGGGAAAQAAQQALLAQQQQQAISPQTVMQNAMTVASTVNYILGNRYAQSGLNYKIETMRLQQQSAAADTAPGAIIAGMIGASPPSRATPGPGASPAKKASIALGSPNAPGKANASSAAADAAANAPTDELAAPAGPSPAELAQQRLAAEVSAYAFLRARHHHRRLILFGVGNKQNEKKQHIIGASAKAMLDYLYAYNNASTGTDDARGNSIVSPSNQLSALYRAAAAPTAHLPEGMAVSRAVSRAPHPRLNALAVKSTGSTIRPTSTIKYLILLHLDFEFDASAAYTDTNAEGTTVYHAPRPTSCSLSRSTKSALDVLAHYVRTRDKTPLSPPDNASSGDAAADEAAAAAAAAAAAQQPFDDVGALIIANDGIPIFTPPPPVDPDAPPPPPVKRPKGYVPPAHITVSDDTTVEALDAIIRPVADAFVEWTIDNGIEKRGGDSDTEAAEKGPSPTSDADGNASGAEGGAAPAAAATNQIPLLPLLTKVYLEPSRDCPHYPLTGTNAFAQFAKAVNSIKPDILVVPSSTPRAVVEAILALPKPHVLLCSE